MEPIRRRRVVSSAQLGLPEVADGAGPPSPVDAEAVTAPVPEGQEEPRAAAGPASEVDSLDDGWDVPETLPAEPAAVMQEPVPAVTKEPVAAAPLEPVAAAPQESVSAVTDDAPVVAPQAAVALVAPDAPRAVAAAAEPRGGDAKRRHDMRAPRATRSTRESDLYKSGPQPPREARAERPREDRPRLDGPREDRPREDRPRGERPQDARARESSDERPRRIRDERIRDDRPRDVTTSERERVRDLLGPRRPDRLQQHRESAERAPLRDIEKTAPSPVDMSFVRKPKPVTAPPVVAAAPPPPPAPNLGDELRFLGAKPVVERKQKPAKSMTAKEVLRQKTKAITDARPGPKTLRSGEVAAVSEPDDEDVASPSSEVVSARDAAPKKDIKNSSGNSGKKKKSAAKVKPSKAAPKKHVEEEDEPISLPKPSFWARVKGFFTGG